MENSSICSACTKRGCREAASQLCEDFHWALKCFLIMSLSDVVNDLPSRYVENFTSSIQIPVIVCLLVRGLLMSP